MAARGDAPSSTFLFADTRSRPRQVVADDRRAGTLGHLGTEYRCCSLECIGRFLGDPDAYIS